MCALVTGVQTCALPIFAFDNPQTLATARHMLAEEILRDRNRASIAIWSVGNETPVSDARNAFLTRSEEHTSELQSLMRISYAVFCLKKKINHHKQRPQYLNTPTRQYTSKTHTYFELTHTQNT